MRDSKKLQNWAPGRNEDRGCQMKKKKYRESIALDQGQPANSYIIKVIM